MPATEKKIQYVERATELLKQYNKILLVGADNVGSAHMQRIRKSLRGHATLLMGKNSMMRRAIRKAIADGCSQYECLLPHIVNNVGLVFTNEECTDVRDILLSQRVGAPAKAGAIAPVDVIIPAGNTGLEPTQTAFLQALNIGTKISRGQIEIISPVHILKEGDKVGSSEATLLAKLNICPFSYGLVLLQVFEEGSIISPSVLDVTPEMIIKSFGVGVTNVACVSLAAGFPTLAALPHVVVNAYKNVLAVAVGTEYCFPRAEKIKQMIENPEAFAAAAPAASAPAAEAAPEPEPEEEEESDDGLGGGLFGDEDDY